MRLGGNQWVLTLGTVRLAFDGYRRSFFEDEVRECRSREEIAGLIEDVEFFRDELSVDVAPLLEKLEEVLAEYEENEEARADHMQDEWKERRYHERASDQSVSDMFGSLRGDRK